MMKKKPKNYYKVFEEEAEEAEEAEEVIKP